MTNGLSKKDILVIAHFTNFPGEAGNSRFTDIINKIDKNKNDVELVTSSFYHILKQQRNLEQFESNSYSYRLKLIREPGYKKNISLMRFFSHFVMAKRLKKYLKKRNRPDVVYCSMPSTSVAKVAAKYAKKNGIRFIIDIQDLWPEAFKIVFKIPLIDKIIFYPLMKNSNYVYSNADEIIAVSETYAMRALKVNKRVQSATAVYLGTDLNKFDSMATTSPKLNKGNDVWIVYVGTLGSSYDLITVMDSLRLVQNQGYRNIKLIIMGDGPLRSKFEEYSKKLNIKIEFKGLLSYHEMIKTLVQCDIAVNPIVKGAAQSIINKVGDYAAAGLPVLSTQENPEYRGLVEKYEIGFNCNNNDSEDLANKFITLIDDKVLMKKMGINNRHLAEEMFDRDRTYSRIVDIIVNSSSKMETRKRD